MSFGIRLTGSQIANNRLSQMIRQAGNIKPALRDSGEYMLLQTRNNFDNSRTPQGSPWAPLKPATIKAKERSKNRKQKRGAKRLYKRTRANPADILKDTFLMRDTITYQLEEDKIAIGSPLVYAASHQFGDRSRGIPQRRFLGLSEGNRREIQRIFRSHLSR